MRGHFHDGPALAADGSLPSKGKLGSQGKLLALALDEVPDLHRTAEALHGVILISDCDGVLRTVARTGALYKRGLY